MHDLNTSTGHASINGHSPRQPPPPKKKKEKQPISCGYISTKAIEPDPGETLQQGEAGKGFWKSEMRYLWLLAADRCTRFSSTRNAQACGACGKQTQPGGGAESTTVET
jgi:hypothetical protein